MDVVFTRFSRMHSCPNESSYPELNLKSKIESREPANKQFLIPETPGLVKLSVNVIANQGGGRYWNGDKR